MCEKCGCAGTDSKDKSFETRIKELIQAVRPNLQGHGGDIELVGIDDDKTVRVRLRGACSGCPGARQTLKMGVEQLIREQVPDLKEVVAVD